MEHCTDCELYEHGLYTEIGGIPSMNPHEVITLSEAAVR